MGRQAHQKNDRSPLKTRSRIRSRASAGKARFHSLHARYPSENVRRPALDHATVRRVRRRRGIEPPLPLSAGEGPDRSFRCVRPSDPDGIRSRRSAHARRSRESRRFPPGPQRHADPLRRDPAGQGHGVDDHQRDGDDPAGAPHRRGGGEGHPSRPARRHRPERHPQRIHLARLLYLSSETIAPDRGGHHRVLREARSPLELYQRLRLPHARGGIDGRPGARLHPGQRDLLRVRVLGTRHRPGHPRPAHLVLLQRAQQFPGGSREVSRRPPPLGAHHEGTVRRNGREGHGLPLPRANRGIHAHLPAAGKQLGAGFAPGPGRPPRRRAVAPHQRHGRGARAPDRTRGQDRAPHAADPGLRNRAAGYRRPVRRVVPPRAGN